MKRLLFHWGLLGLLGLGCLFFRCDFMSDHSDSASPEYSLIPFRSFHRAKRFFIGTSETRLFVFRSAEEFVAFKDTVRTVVSLPTYSSFDDSMVVGIVFDGNVSVSTTFEIDSVMEFEDRIEVRSHLDVPIGQMKLYGAQSHFVVIPRHDQWVRLGPIATHLERCDGEPVPFTELLREPHLFLNDQDEPRLVVLRDTADQRVFMDTTRIGVTHFDFPVLSYEDSMVVGVLMPEWYDSSDHFEIVSAIWGRDTLDIYTQVYIPSATIPDRAWPCHFVVLKKIDGPVRLKAHRTLYADDSLIPQGLDRVGQGLL